MQSRSSYLIKNTVIFSIGNFATKIISFFLIPLYTNILTTVEYGIIDLVVTLATIAVPVLTLNIMESVMRFNLDKDADKDKITKIGIVILCFGAIFGLILIPICELWDQLSSLNLLIYFYVISIAACQIFLCDLRGKELLVQYSIGNILNTILIAVFNMLFLLCFQLGIFGYLLAYTLANSVVAFYALIIGRGYHAIGAKLDCKKAREMLKYSTVLIPNSFMWWIMNSSDHVMVTSMVGVSANGLYAISYKIPTLITTFMGIFNQAWSYSAIREEGAVDEEEYNNRILNAMIGIVMLLGIFMMCMMKPFLNIYVSPDYFSAWQYTPFLIIGCVFLSIATFMATSYTVHKDSIGFLMSAAIGAILNTILNFLLIPKISVYGAAIATCISYITVFLFRYLHTRKYIRYRVITKEFSLGIFLLILSGIFMFQDGYIYKYYQLIIFVFYVIVSKKCWLPLLFEICKKIRSR